MWEPLAFRYCLEKSCRGPAGRNAVEFGKHLMPTNNGDGSGLCVVAVARSGDQARLVYRNFNLGMS